MVHAGANLYLLRCRRCDGRRAVVAGVAKRRCLGSRRRHLQLHPYFGPFIGEACELDVSRQENHGERFA